MTNKQTYSKRFGFGQGGKASNQKKCIEIHDFCEKMQPLRPQIQNGKSINKVLIIGPAWVGDMVMSHSLYRLLRSQNPNVIIDVLAPKASGSVVNRIPEVRRFIPIDIGHGQLALWQRYRIARSLRSEKYQQAIILTNSFKSALIPFWAKIPIRTSWRGEMRYGLVNDMRYLDKKKLPLMVTRFIALGVSKQVSLPEPILLPTLTIPNDACTRAQQKHIHKGSRPVLALCPGAEFGPAKQWPADYVTTVGRTFIDKGWDVWLFGGPNDATVTTQIANDINSEHCYNLGGKTTLTEAIDLLSLVDAVIANDSGLMHTAAALKRPLVVTYGSTDPDFAPPLTQHAKSLSLRLECSPCAQRECPLGHLHCLKELTPNTVINTLEELIVSTKKLTTLSTTQPIVLSHNIHAIQ